MNQTGISPLSLPVNIKLRILPVNGYHNKDMRLNGPELKNYQEYISFLYVWNSNLKNLIGLLLLSVQFVIDYLKKQVEKKSDRIIEVPDDLIILNLGWFDWILTLLEPYLTVVFY